VHPPLPVVLRRLTPSTAPLSSVPSFPPFPTFPPSLINRFIPPEFLPEAYFDDARCTGSADFGQSDEELRIRRHVEEVLIKTGTTPIGVDLSKYCLQELEKS
jgi:hypothetical protein